MNKGKKKEKDYACCDRAKMTCETCNFEDSIKVNDDYEDENEE